MKLFYTAGYQHIRALLALTQIFEPQFGLCLVLFTLFFVCLFFRGVVKQKMVKKTKQNKKQTQGFIKSTTI